MTQNEAMASSTGTTKPDATCLAAVDLARAAAEETSGAIGVAEYLGAQAATCAYGGATSNGGASGLWKSEGRSLGAYSGPSSHVAMQSS